MKKIKFFLFICIIIVFLSSIFYYLFLPDLLENSLKKTIKNIGLSNPKLQVRIATPYKLDIKNFFSGPSGNPSLKIPSISVDFSPLSLWEKRIESIRLSDASLILEYSNNTLSLQGLKFSKDTSKKNNTEWSFNTLILDKSQIQFTIANKTFYIPFEGSIKQKKNKGQFSLEFSLFFFGDKISLKADWDIIKNKGNLNIICPSFNLQNIERTFNNQFPLFFRGNTALNAKLSINEDQISKANLSLKAEKLQIFYDDIQANGNVVVNAEYSRISSLTSMTLETEIVKAKYKNIIINKPLKLSINSKDLKSFNYQFSSTAISNSFLSGQIDSEESSINIHEIKGKFIWDDKHWTANGDYNCSIKIDVISDLLKNNGFQLLNNSKYNIFGFKGSFSSEFKKKELLWKVLGIGENRLELQFVNHNLKTRHCKIEFSAEGNSNIALAHVDLKTKQPFLEWNRKNVLNKLSAAEIKANGIFKYNISSGKMSTSVGIRMFSANIKAENSFEAKGINLNTSLSWPPRKDRKKGYFNIKSLYFAGTRVDSVSGEIFQDGKNVLFSGQIPLAIPSLILNFSGSLLVFNGDQEMKLALNVPVTKLPSNTSLTKLHPFLKGINVDGEFGFSARLTSDFNMQGMLKIKNASLSLPESKVLLEGVNSEISFKDMFRFISEPGINLKFKKISFGDVFLTDGQFVFTIENTDSVFFERGMFKWCNGRLHANSFRYYFDEKKKKDFKLILYCDKN